MKKETPRRYLGKLIRERKRTKSLVGKALISGNILTAMQIMKMWLDDRSGKKEIRKELKRAIKMGKRNNEFTG